MAFLNSDRYGAAWRGSLFVGSVKFGFLTRLVVSDTNVIGEERLLQSIGQWTRDVRQGPDGLMYVLTDAPNGRLIRLNPVRQP
jgi:glucose/arabinose dehydrogenase